MDFVAQNQNVVLTGNLKVEKTILRIFFFQTQHKIPSTEVSIIIYVC